MTRRTPALRVPAALLVALALVGAACGADGPVAADPPWRGRSPGRRSGGLGPLGAANVQPAGGARLGLGAGVGAGARAARPGRPAGRSGRAGARRALDGRRRWAVGRADPASERHLRRRRTVHLGRRRLLARGGLRRGAGEPAGRRAPDRREAAHGDGDRVACGARHVSGGVQPRCAAPEQPADSAGTPPGRRPCRRHAGRDVGSRYAAGCDDGARTVRAPGLSARSAVGVRAQPELLASGDRRPAAAVSRQPHPRDRARPECGGAATRGRDDRLHPDRDPCRGRPELPASRRVG